jgi:uncharacterized delta-60 repeat protein
MLLTEDGDLDTDFGTGGIVTIDIDGGNESARQAVVQPDGMIVMAGYSSKSGVVIPQLVRVDDSGELDPSFGAGGIASVQLLPEVAEAYADRGRDLVVFPDGRVLIAGSGKPSAADIHRHNCPHRGGHSDRSIRGQGDRPGRGYERVHPGGRRGLYGHPSCRLGCRKRYAALRCSARSFADPLARSAVARDNCAFLGLSP